MTVLDVGCGDRPAGDVNLDRFYYGKWKNFVIAEAHHLPLRNNVFDKVYSKHCLEHFGDPLKFFKEAKRVLKNGGSLECIYPTDTLLTKKLSITSSTCDGHPLSSGSQKLQEPTKSITAATNGN